MDAEDIYCSFERIEHMKQDQFETLKTSLQSCDIRPFEKIIQEEKYYYNYLVSPTLLLNLFNENVFEEEIEYIDFENEKEKEEYIGNEKTRIDRVSELTKILLDKNPTLEYINFKGKYGSALDRVIECKKGQLFNMLFDYMYKLSFK
jgi:hypothetical protein